MNDPTITPLLKNLNRFLVRPNESTTTMPPSFSECIMALPHGNYKFLYISSTKGLAYIIHTHPRQPHIVEPVQMNASFYLPRDTLLYGICSPYSSATASIPDLTPDATSGPRVFLFCMVDILLYGGQPRNYWSIRKKIDSLHIAKDGFQSLPHPSNPGQIPRPTIIVGLPALNWHNQAHQLYCDAHLFGYKVSHFAYILQNKCIKYLSVDNLLRSIYQSKQPAVATTRMMWTIADIQPDIYLLFTHYTQAFEYLTGFGDNGGKCYSSAQHPPSQNSLSNKYGGRNSNGPQTALVSTMGESVFMNSLFRNIKENQNIDLLEESDDDEEFEDARIDKYVDLTKCIHLPYRFCQRFKRWVPIITHSIPPNQIKKIEV